MDGKVFNSFTQRKMPDFDDIFFFLNESNVRKMFVSAKMLIQNMKNPISFKVLEENT